MILNKKNIRLVLLISLLLMISFGVKVNDNNIAYQTHLWKGTPLTNGVIPIWNVTWAGLIGVSEGKDLEFDSLGNLYEFGNTDCFGAGGGDLLLIKYDQDGNQIWNRTWGNSDHEYYGGIAVDSSDNIYITGTRYTPASTVLIKYNGLGAQLWNVSWNPYGPTHNTYVYDVETDSSDNAYIVGLDPNLQSPFLLKFNNAGVLINYTLIPEGFPSVNHDYGIYIDSSDNLFISGGPFHSYTNFLLAKYSSSCHQIWNKTLSIGDGGTNHAPVTDICVDPIGNIYISGFIEPNHGILLKYDSTGNQIWNRTVRNMLAYSVALDNDSNPYIGGLHAIGHQSQGFLIKFSSNGIFQWNQTLLIEGLDTNFNGIALDESDAVYCTGYYGPYNTGIIDIITAKFDFVDYNPETNLVKVPDADIYFSDINITWTGSDDITPTEQLVYSYYLEGYDSGWSPWTSQTSKLYEFLENGTYTFYVRAKDTGDNIDPTPATTTFTVATPDWRRYAQIGDILLHRSFGALYFFLNWTHAGIYLGEGKVAEARAPWDGGVGTYNIIDWDYPNTRQVILLNVTSVSPKLRQQAAIWAKFQAERYYPWPFKGYDFNLIQKSADPSSSKWYCSELVWASYYNNGLNLDDNDDLSDPVSPDDLNVSDHTEIIGSHILPLLEISNRYLLIRVYCPVNLRITDPDGLIISNSISEINDTCYLEQDMNSDGIPDDAIGLPLLKYGKYTVEILQESGALLNDSFSLTVSLDDITLPIAEDVLISELSGTPYVFYVDENGIHLTPPGETPPGIGGYDVFYMIFSIVGIIALVSLNYKRKK